MKQIIFDLDDTLYSNKTMQIKREKAILKYLGENKIKYQELKKQNGTIASLKLLGIDKKQFFRIINQVKIEAEVDYKLIEIFKLIRKDFKTVILSNNSEYCVKETLNKLGIADLIDQIFTGEDFEESKPSEECFFMVKPGDICVGNNFEKDLKYPMKKGAITILIGESNKACFNIKNIYELEDCLSQIKKFPKNFSLFKSCVAGPRGSDQDLKIKTKEEQEIK